MQVKNVTKPELEATLKVVNSVFSGNVRWNRIDPLNKKGTRWAVTLRVKDSKLPGHRLGQSGLMGLSGMRRLVSACWHVHGKFIDSLPTIAIIRTSGLILRPGFRWVDRNIGSSMAPVMYSEACEC